jgi:tetratricopeptide (TPR) repeat protein
MRVVGQGEQGRTPRPAPRGLLGLLPALALAGLLLQPGCGVTGSGGDEGTSLLADAWARYRQQRWEEARQLFQRLVDEDLSVAEAYAGLGWSRLHLLQPAQARLAFQNSLVGDEHRLESRAGEAFALRDTGGDTARLLDQARTVLLIDPDWRFLHEPAVDWMDLQVLMAQTFFLRQQFDSSLARCRQVDPAMALSRADSLSWQGAASFELALFAELTRLGQLVTE